MHRSVVVVQLLSHVWLCGCMDCSTPATLFFTISQVFSYSCPLSQRFYPTTSSSVAPFSFCLQSLPASGSFPMSRLFASGVQSIGASTSASVLPVNIQNWFLLRLTGLISLRSKGLSRAKGLSWRPQFKSINSSALRIGPTLTSIHDHPKNHRFDYMDLCQQSNVSAF